MLSSCFTPVYLGNPHRLIIFVSWRNVNYFVQEELTKLGGLTGKVSGSLLGERGEMYGRHEGIFPKSFSILKNFDLQNIPCIYKECRLNVLRCDELHLVFGIALNQWKDDGCFYSTCDQDRPTSGAAKRRIFRRDFFSLHGLEFPKILERFRICNL